MSVKEMITSAWRQQRLWKLRCEKERAQGEPDDLLDMVRNAWRAVNVTRIADYESVDNG